MKTKALATLVHLLQQSRLNQAGVVTDAELLGRFVTQRDEAAFEALLQQHGPMVLGVCRRILHNDANVEDCFQATFLVLVRRVAYIRPRSKVGNWLHTVARNAALKAKAMSNLRQKKETAAAVEKARISVDHNHHLEELLDEELESLPDKYRAAVILCDLESLTMAAAAARLGCLQGTVKSRLARGRALLAKRLARRGVTLGVGVVAAALAQHTVSAAVPAPLVTSTIKAAGLLAAGKAASGVIGAKVAALMKGVLKTMLLTKLKTLAIVLVVAASIVGTGTIVAVSQKAGSQADQKSPTAAETKPQRDPAPPGQPGPVPDQAKDPEASPPPPRDSEGDPLPEGAVARLGTSRFCQGSPITSMTLTRNGKTLATVACDETNYSVIPKPFSKNVCVKVWNMADGKLRRQLNDKTYRAAVFLSDNKTLALATYGAGVVLVDVDTGKETQHLDTPNSTEALALSPDGKTLAHLVHRPPRRSRRLDGTQDRRLSFRPCCRRQADATDRAEHYARIHVE